MEGEGSEKLRAGIRTAGAFFCERSGCPFGREVVGEKSKG